MGTYIVPSDFSSSDPWKSETGPVPLHGKTIVMSESNATKILENLI